MTRYPTADVRAHFYDTALLSSEGHSLPCPTESPIKSCKLSSPRTFIRQSKKERTVLGNLLGHFYDKVKLSFKVQNCPSIPSKAPSFPHHLQNDSKMFLDWEFPRLKWGLIHLSLSPSLSPWQTPLDRFPIALLPKSGVRQQKTGARWDKISEE